MKKHKFILHVSFMLLIAATPYSCGKTSGATRNDTFKLQALRSPTYDPLILGYSMPIPDDTANRMIMSYLTSIDYTVNTNETRSLLFNADTMRHYLADTSIKEIKFFLAHNQEYINSGNEGQRPKPNMNALTIIPVGLDLSGNYVHPIPGMVYDRLQPCPDFCINGNIIP